MAPTALVAFPFSLPLIPNYSIPLSIMSAGPSTSTSTSRSNFLPIFNAALESYKSKTKNDLASHPLLASFQSCDSPEAVLTVLRDQIPAFNQSQSRDDCLTKWVIPTVNVLYTFSSTVGQGVGLVNISDFCWEECSNLFFQAFPPANAIFAGISVLLSVGVSLLSPVQPIVDAALQAANDASASRDKLINILNHIELFFRRLEIYTGITLTTAMTDMIVEIMVEVLTILAITTKEVKCGRFSELIHSIFTLTD